MRTPKMDKAALFRRRLVHLVKRDVPSNNIGHRTNKKTKGV